MNEREAFIRAICADPFDDLPRLVYADWLEENASGDPCGACGGSGFPVPSLADLPPVRERVGADGRIERYQEFPPFDYRVRRCEGCSGAGSIPNHNAALAEFIRLGVRLGEWQAGRSAAADFDEAVAVGVRWNELIADAHRYLPASVRDAGRGFRERFDRIDGTLGWTEDASIPMRVRFDRGFVDAVQCDLAAFLRHAGALFAAHPVTAVRLTDCEPGQELDGYCWYARGDRLDPDSIPSELVPAMNAAIRADPRAFALGECARFPTRAAALEALSAAAVAYGRSVAAGVTHTVTCPSCSGEGCSGNIGYLDDPKQRCGGVGYLVRPGLPPLRPTEAMT